MRWLPTKLHALIDIALVIALLVLPRALGWGDPSHITGQYANGLPSTGENGVLVCSALALIIAIYSFFTAYEIGVIKVLSMEHHLLLDSVTGVILLGMAWLMASQGMLFTPLVALLGLVQMTAFGITKVQTSVPTKWDDAYTFKNFLAEWRKEQWESNA